MASYGDKVRYFWQENQGIAATRTAACRLARGEFIAFQDDDDLMPPDRIVHLYEGLRQYPSAVFATGDYALIDAEGNLTGKRWLPGSLEDREKPVLIDDAYTAVLWPKVPAVPHTTLFRKSDGDRIGWFDIRFTYACSDADFFARLSKLGPIVYVKEVISYYRRGHTAIWSNELLATYSRLQLFEKHITSMDAKNKKLRRRLQDRIRMALIRIAFYKSIGIKVDDSILKDYINRGFSLLGLKDRLTYRWHTWVKYPIRRIVRGTN
ncbi:MAG: glycosyltransferase [Deltaproteobacteria bacterium]|nr:glycosyltransferase [Deltaproteobacteria bacterium]